MKWQSSSGVYGRRIFRRGFKSPHTTIYKYSINLKTKKHYDKIYYLQVYQQVHCGRRQ